MCAPEDLSQLLFSHAVAAVVEAKLVSRDCCRYEKRMCEKIARMNERERGGEWKKVPHTFAA